MHRRSSVAQRNEVDSFRRSNHRTRNWSRYTEDDANVQTQESSWIYRAKTPSDEGAQIDMLIDRADHCTNICEMKFSMHPFKIDKAYAADLERKVRVFSRQTKTSNAIFLTLISTHGIDPNDHAQRLVASQVQLSQLIGG